jgi:hypothetical protein
MKFEDMSYEMPLRSTAGFTLKPAQVMCSEMGIGGINPLDRF